MFNTAWPADSVEFCPCEGLQNIFVCGTYKLESTQAKNDSDDNDALQETTTAMQTTRQGKCLVFRLSSGDDIPCQLQEIDLPAVLDMKWCHRSPASNPVLGIADSEGNVSLHEWFEARLVPLQRLSLASDDVLCLSIDWSNRRYPTNGLGNLIASLSDGSLALLRPSSQDQGTLAISDKWHAHDHEPWSAAWNYWDDSVIYSGGDDLQMKGWDHRQGFDRPIFINKRFDAGVTAIQSNPYIEHLIAVGSYDHKVRLFDTRKPLQPFTDVDVGGGAWRVKWHPSAERKHDLVVACMHDGFKVVRFHPPDSGVEIANGDITQRFDRHESLAYGVDWSFRQYTSGDNTLIASCSFYDCALHIWTG